MLWLLGRRGPRHRSTPAGSSTSAPTEAEDLADRAHAGLRSSGRATSATPGSDAPRGPGAPRPPAAARPPAPPRLFALAEGRWRADPPPRPGPLGSCCPAAARAPLGRARRCVAATAALIALGITSALAVDRDGRTARHPRGRSGRRPRRRPGVDPSDAAAPPARCRWSPRPTSTTGPSGRRPARPGRRGLAGTSDHQRHRSSQPPRGHVVVSRRRRRRVTIGTGDGAPPTTTTVAPLLEVTVGLGDAPRPQPRRPVHRPRARSAPSSAAPRTRRTTGLTLDVDSALLPGS